MRWLPFLMLLAGCPKGGSPTAVDGGIAIAEAIDAGPLVTEARLAAWLEWQKAMSALKVGDAGRGDLKWRAKAELVLLADAGLSIQQVDALEAVIAAVVAERSVSKLTGAEALAKFKAGLAQMSPEQRAKAEAALTELQAKTPQQGSLAAVEAEFGPDAVRVVLAREAEVSKAWDALLEARTGP
ncbi:MAG: hypothetical protein QM817_19325 [Archangium sp.]